MADILNAVREVYQRFGRDHPMLSHLAGIPEETYLRNRPHFDARTATKWALAKTSYPQLARPVTHQGPAPLMTAIGAQGGSNPSPGSDIPSWPTAWDAVRHPVQSYERYIASWRKQFPRYVHDPIGATKADFQSYRSNGRVLDLVGARAEEAAANAAVIAAKAVDIALGHLPVIPRALGGPDLDSPTLTPGRRKFAPAVEAAMLPLKQDAALRPPTNYWERSVAGTTDAAMLLSAPVGAGAEIAGEARGVQQGLGAAAAEFRTLLARAKSWDEAFAALSARSKTVLSNFWFRAGRTGATEAEEAAAWGDKARSISTAEKPRGASSGPSSQSHRSGNDSFQELPEEGPSLDRRAPAEQAPRYPESVDLPPLKHKSGWTAQQRAQAEAKARLLNEADTVVAAAKRPATSASKVYRRAGGQLSPNAEVDHKIDLQLGGSHDSSNMWSLDQSVNRNLGAQVRHRTKNLPRGTRVNRVTIEDR